MSDAPQRTSILNRDLERLVPRAKAAVIIALALLVIAIFAGMLVPPRTSNPRTIVSSLIFHESASLRRATPYDEPIDVGDIVNAVTKRIETGSLRTRVQIRRTRSGDEWSRRSVFFQLRNSQTGEFALIAQRTPGGPIELVLSADREHNAEPPQFVSKLIETGDWMLHSADGVMVIDRD